MQTCPLLLTEALRPRQTPNLHCPSNSRGSAGWIVTRVGACFSGMRLRVSSSRATTTMSLADDRQLGDRWCVDACPDQIFNETADRVQQFVSQTRLASEDEWDDAGKRCEAAWHVFGACRQACQLAHQFNPAFYLLSKTAARRIDPYDGFINPPPLIPTNRPSLIRKPHDSSPFSEIGCLIGEKIAVVAVA